MLALFRAIAPQQDVAQTLLDAHPEANMRASKMNGAVLVLATLIAGCTIEEGDNSYGTGEAAGAAGTTGTGGTAGTGGAAGVGGIAATGGAAGTGDPCEGVTCSNHGTCTVSQGQASCDCEAGYHADGLACVQDTGGPCDGVTCSDHGICSVVDGAALCTCDSGYHMVDAVNCEEGGQGCVQNTDWGFQPFTVPSDTESLQDGDDIQAAIDSLPNGGTVNLGAGDYSGSRIKLKSNMVLQGAGVGQTTISFNGSSDNPLIQMLEGENVILRGFTANCTGTAANGIEFIHGPDNILIEDIEVFGANKSNLLVYNVSWNAATQHITIRNVSSYDANLWHGIGLRFVEGAVVCNCNSYNLGGYGLDASSVRYAEVSGCSFHDNGEGGCKFPASDYIYIHDTTVLNNPSVGIKFDYGVNGTGLMHFHIEDTEVGNSGSGVVDWGDEYGPPTFEEMVLIGNDIHDNVSEGQDYNSVRLRGCNAAHEYGDNIGLTIARAGTINAIAHQSGTPETDGIGWVSWPGPQ